MANGTIAASQIEMLSQSGTGITTIVPPATNSDRTLTLPDASTTVVGTDATQTLTNKTIQGGTITSATAVSASGASVDFTGIPSWVKRITVMFSGVSTNGSSSYLIQLGTSGGFTTSGYSATGAFGGASAGYVDSTAGMVIFNNSNTASMSGQTVLTNISGNSWVSSYAMRWLAGYVVTGGGTVTLGSTLDRVRFTTVNGTDTFDAGTINIMYEG